MKKKVETTKENQSRMNKNFSTDEMPMPNAKDVIELILDDHKPLKKLIKTLKEGEIKRDQKEELFEEFAVLLMGHAKAEEKSLYVQMREIKALRMLSFEGDTEHAIAEQLLHEINATPDDDEWNAKVKVLAELVEHHIKEEEDEMLLEVEEKMDLDTRLNVGEIYSEIKMELDALRQPRVMFWRENMDQQAL